MPLKLKGQRALRDYRRQQQALPAVVDPTTALELKDVFFSYQRRGVDVLRGINLRVPAGKYVTVVGHNGSGKSTLAKLIMGIFNFDRGTIRVFGTKLTNDNLSQLRRFLGIVFQNPDNQFIGSTVEDDIAFGLENRQVPAPAMRQIIETCARKVNMQHCLESEPLMLSGGQKQQAAIASVLALAPRIIIFDEATSMLDLTGETTIHSLMNDLKTNEGKTIISITHNIEEALKSDLVIVLNQGQVVASGDPRRVLMDYELLEKIGLEVPMTLRIALALKQSGLAVDLTLNENHLMQQILRLR